MTGFVIWFNPQNIIPFMDSPPARFMNMRAPPKQKGRGTPIVNRKTRRIRVIVTSVVISMKRPPF